MSDIVERLREWAAPFPTGVDAPLLGSDLHKAADEIERLRAALHEIETKSRGWERGTSAEINKIAKEALDE